MGRPALFVWASTFLGLRGRMSTVLLRHLRRRWTVGGGWWYGSVVSGRYVIFIIGGRWAGTEGWIADERE
jgi:hypothetical protein